MATYDAGQEGSLNIARAQSGFQPSTWGFNPSAYNQTLVPFYKMQGKCSVHGWDSWVNGTGDESGRAVHGVQEAGTIVVKWFVPQGL